MLKRLDKRNQALWQGYPSVVEDVTHVVGGIGIGLLLQPALRARTKSIGWSMVALSTAMHIYADLVKPSRNGLRAKLRIA